MPDFRVADTAPDHLKMRRAGLAAAGLWSLAGAWAMRELTDGWVPEYWVLTWPQGGKHAATLVEIGMWQPEEQHGLPGYRFRDWTDYQRPADKIRDDRAKGAERAAKSRARASERNGARPSATSRETRGARDANAARESHDSLPLPLTPGGPGGMNGSPPARADSQPAPQNPPRCRDHAAIPADQPVPPCGACRDLRRQHDDRTLADVAAEAHRRRADAEARRAAIDACTGCDDQGWRDTGAGLARCDHQPAEARS